ncbi:hypothetical protein LZ480_08060 [Solibacillus sp. MA9]|uniref:Uncharacterized protein n=1 Tax=Solibacillus palustris TaxID=2908203 RepID=A0ABS9UBX0_9BACL|nr:hypothetical protein [Solibacillus sp. MA9]MCH7321845.1 hypothetical protein [Solibacillus sp. MA9]
MNNFQKERTKLMPKKGLSEASKRAVIQAVHTPNRKSKKWVPAVTVAGVVAASSFLLLIEQKQEQPVTSEIEQSLTSESFAESFIQDNHLQNTEVLYEQHDVRSKNDEFIIVKEIVDGESLYQFAFGHYNEKEQRWWTDERMTLFEDFPVTVTNFAIDSGQLKIGLIENEQVEAICIGDKQATIVEDSAGQRIWFHFEDSIFKPVYEVIDGKKSRMASSINARVDSIVPILEPVEEHLQTVQYEDNTMHRGHDEYTKFPLVIDPYYYVQESYKMGDVIAYKQDGKLQISRILATDEGSISLVDDTLIKGEYIQPLDGPFYMWPTYDGDNGIYKGQSKIYDKPNRDELLVIPDNWASDGYQGIIEKSQIVGAVLGYDLTQLTNTLTVEELQLFAQLQRSKENVEALLKDSSVNTIVRLYLYANYVEDYQLMYALMDITEEVPPYEQWKKQVVKTNKQHLLKDIYEMGYAQLTKDESKLRFTDPMSENIINQYKVSKTDKGWRVGYTTVSGNLD